MVSISHRPIKEFVVYKGIKFSSPGALARRALVESGPVTPAHLNWIGGIAYRLSYPASVVTSDTIIKEFLDGRLWVEVEFAEMPTFKSTVNSEEENVVIPVLNTSNDPDEAVLVEWLKRSR